MPTRSLQLLCAALAVAAHAATIPTRPLAGGGSRLPMLIMGGGKLDEWFALAGKGAAFQTFWGYHNGAKLAPQIAEAGRENVFISAGLPCGGIGDPASDTPGHPMNASAAAAFIDSELQQLNVASVDLLLVHHRCRAAATTHAVWGAMEAAKKAGKAKHIGVSNFNAFDLHDLQSWAGRTLPIEANEAHFTVGEIDFEALAYMQVHDIVGIGFSSLAAAVPMNNRCCCAAVAACHAVPTAPCS